MRRYDETGNNYIASAIYPMVQLGRYDEARKIIDTAKNSKGMDTLSIDFVKLLKEELRMEKQIGNHAACLGIAERNEE